MIILPTLYFTDQKYSKNKATKDRNIRNRENHDHSEIFQHSFNYFKAKALFQHNL